MRPGESSDVPHAGGGRRSVNSGNACTAGCGPTSDKEVFMAKRTRKRTNRRKAFTARGIASLKPEAHAVDWFDATTPGLALHVSPGGAKSWFLFYKHGRTTRRVKLGTWPALELAKARTAARDERGRIERDGADPAYERKEARDVFTVGMLTKLFIESYAKAHKRTWRDDQWRIDRYLLPAWKSRAVADITRQDVHAVLDGIAADGKPIQANRTQALISKLWNFAIDRGHAAVNPCHRMAKRAPEVARATVLDDDALRALWRALDAEGGDAAAAVRLRLLTGARGGEVHAMAWGDVDLETGVWTIPATASKNRRAHRVPLAATALGILQARHADQQAKARQVRKPADSVVENLPPQNAEKARDAAGQNQVGTSPKLPTGPVFPGLYHQRKDLRALGALHGDAYRWHDLRRTVVTRLAALGFGEDLIG
ncbi:MAG: tyrosine-type recombinase/integrase, partial [Vicinamibacterales bacterium]